LGKERKSIAPEKRHPAKKKPRNCKSGFRGIVMPKKKFVRVCPKCGSTDIRLPDLQPTDLNEAPAQFASARMLGARCKKCGHH